MCVVISVSAFETNDITSAGGLWPPLRRSPGFSNVVVLKCTSSAIVDFIRGTHAAH